MAEPKGTGRTAAVAIAATMVAVALVLAFFPGRRSGGGGEGELRVLCSFLPVYVFTLNVVGDAPGVRVTSMLPADLGCPHDYALTPEDMRKIAEADLLVVQGLGIEGFLGDPVRRANPNVTVAVASEGIAPLRSGETIAWAEGDGGGHGNHEGHEHEESNPHAWVSLAGAQAEVRNIAEALGKARPELKEKFRANAEAYCGRLGRLREEFLAAVKGFPNVKVVMFHDAFDYFAKDVGIEIVAIIEDAPGQQPSAGAMVKLADAIRRTKAAAIFSEPQHSDRVARTIGRETGVPVYSLDPVASGEARADGYETAMRRNLGTLVRALGPR